jgi:hypothetical protein
MYKKEYKPLFDKGFKQIALWQLDSTFLEPFEDNEHRKYLIDRLNAFINEFQFLGLEAEIWIDGSFSTHKPEPQDVDVVFLLDQKAVASLDSKKEQLFQELFMKREEVRVRYSLDVYFIDKDDVEDKQKWISTYGFDSRKMNSKGIYKLEL